MVITTTIVTLRAIKRYLEVIAL